jgi:hypothetical protein
MAIINTRLRTNGCALILNAEDMAIQVAVISASPTKNKGVLLRILALLRAQRLVRRRVFVMATRLGVSLPRLNPKRQ